MAIINDFSYNYKHEAASLQDLCYCQRRALPFWARQNCATLCACAPVCKIPDMILHSARAGTHNMVETRCQAETNLLSGVLLFRWVSTPQCLCTDAGIGSLHDELSGQKLL